MKFLAGPEKKRHLLPHRGAVSTQWLRFVLLRQQICHKSKGALGPPSSAQSPSPPGQTVVAFEIAPISAEASIISFASPPVESAESRVETYLIDALHFACCPLSSNSHKPAAEEEEGRMLGSHCIRLRVSVCVSEYLYLWSSQADLTASLRVGPRLGSPLRAFERLPTPIRGL